ncbi:PP2C-domain-containing protein [Punctularia strigosozonata HHB-11173 SS5]|uniref:PP2C-domain-containing protein n=1 Tax=Punctularia strigosozonata (strain HHB-11173) TaxID=741275 RepID=UPI00044175A0|nr:PP2C-domain-containing protein [Punctularia strigosozonata HHB-11173 SS5]EIN12613.1 PP2C-domain-containing protein [Punctularia strigosozonata HHB-11173 SS5]
MGQTLSQPATEKKTESGGDARFLYAVSEMQGWRISMEDAHTVALQLEEEGTDKHNSFFAVYDGHGGAAAAKFAGERVHQLLQQEESYRSEQWEQAMKQAFLHTDEEMIKDPSHLRDPSGCTAVAALITHDNKLLVANAGDSRSVLSVKGEVKAMSYDHKPQNESEKSRIVAAGGYVEYGRVNGNLALSRALGDFEYKKNLSLSAENQIITCDPDIMTHDITDDDEFLVLACDGIWDCLSSQQVVNIVRRWVAEGKELGEICEQICEHCLAPDTTSGAGIGCDNMTILIVALLHGKTKEEWYAWIKDRVENKYGYDTPEEIPQLFAQSRLMAFRARRQALAERNQDQDGRQNGPAGNLGGLLSAGGLGGFARVLGSTGGITFHPGSGIVSDSGLMFEKYDDSDEDDTDEDMDVDGANGSRSFFSETFGTGAPDGTKSLREQLADLEKDSDSDMNEEEAEEAGVGTFSRSGQPQDTPNPDATTPIPIGNVDHVLQGEAPPPPKSLPNGDAKQLESEPGGDEPHPAVKAEGLLDKSEDPIKAST